MHLKHHRCTACFISRSRRLVLIFLAMLGNGIINVEGELWKIQRKSGIRFLNNTNLKTLLDQVLPRYLGDVEKLLNKAAETKMVVDLQGVLLELTTRLMGEMAYNVSNRFRVGLEANLLSHGSA